MEHILGGGGGGRWGSGGQVGRGNQPVEKPNPVDSIPLATSIQKMPRCVRLITAHPYGFINEFGHRFAIHEKHAHSRRLLLAFLACGTRNGEQGEMRVDIIGWRRHTSAGACSRSGSLLSIVLADIFDQFGIVGGVQIVHGFAQRRRPGRWLGVIGSFKVIQVPLYSSCCE